VTLNAVFYGGAVAAGLGFAVMKEARVIWLVNAGYAMVMSGVGAALVGIGMAIR
jgi:hypothetical protein